MKPANLTQRMALAAVRTALKLRIWRRGLPLSVVRSLLDKVAGGGDGPAAFATREPSIHNSDRRFVVAGHTHSPDVVPIGKASSEQVYVDTGTWRNKVLPMAAGEGFVRLKSLSYLTVFGSDEDGGRTSASGGRQESFDFWSGFAEKWS
jgi:hypothetical protein